MTYATGKLSLIRCNNCQEFPNGRSSGVTMSLNDWKESFYYCQCGNKIIMNDDANWEEAE